MASPAVGSTERQRWQKEDTPMSTRCQIAVTGDDGRIYPCKIYKHCDGYPAGVLPILEPFAERFARQRGHDPEYLVAQIIRHFAREQEGEEFTGWGVDLGWHGDLSYLYVVDKQGRVTCYQDIDTEKSGPGGLPGCRVAFGPGEFQAPV
jgi:hypothetical protein